MTTVAVLADPPDSETAFPELQDALSPTAAVDLYTAMLRDVCVAVQQSGGELLVNYRSADQLPAAADVDDAEQTVREAVEPALPDPSAARFEVQVGSSYSARAGNTVTHLLETEAVQTAAITDPRAGFLARQQIDSAAMKLRSSSVVLGPSTEGRVYYAGFADTIDFTDAFADDPLTTLPERAREGDLGVDFVEMRPMLEREGDLSTVLTTIAARETASQWVPTHTAAAIDDLVLAVEDLRSDGS